MNCELPDVQADFKKGRGTRDQIANICWIIEKARDFQKKNIYFCFIDYAKAFDCIQISQETGQEAAVRTGHGATDWFQIGKGACQGCILSPCLFNLYAENIMRYSPYLTYLISVCGKGELYSTKNKLNKTYRAKDVNII